MAVNDIYLVSLDQQMHTTICTNTFHYKELTTGSEPDTAAEALVNAWLSTNLPVWVANLSTDWTAICIRARRIDPEEGSEFVQSITAANQGTIGTDGLPPNSVAQCTLYGIPPGPNTRNRKYVSGLDENDESDNHLTPTGATHWGNITNTFDDDFNGVGGGFDFSPVVWSNKLKQAVAVELVEARSPLGKLRSRTPRICISSG